MPVREDTYSQPLACEVGWPVPFHVAFKSLMLPPGTPWCLIEGGFEIVGGEGLEKFPNLISELDLGGWNRPGGLENCLQFNRRKYGKVLREIWCEKVLSKR